MVAVPPGLEAALGAALGEASESPTDLDAPRHWRRLPPLDGAPLLPPGATSLAELVDAPPDLARALSQAGLLAEDADGTALQAVLAPGQVLVGPDGAVWRWDGHTARADAPNPAQPGSAFATG